METIKCKNCGTLYPSTNEKCPTCGEISVGGEAEKLDTKNGVDHTSNVPKPERKNFTSIVAAALVVFVILVAMFYNSQMSNGDKETAAEATPMSTPTITPTTTPTATPERTLSPSPVQTPIPEPAAAPLKPSVDWEQCAESTKTELTGLGLYPYVKDVSFSVDDDSKIIAMTAVLSDSTDPQVALEFADTMIRRFNANAQMQDGSIKSASKDYYGGVFDEYGAFVGIAPLSKAGSNTSEWFVYDVVTKGMHTRQAPKLQKKYLR